MGDLFITRVIRSPLNLLPQRGHALAPDFWYLCQLVFQLLHLTERSGNVHSVSSINLRTLGSSTGISRLRCVILRAFRGVRLDVLQILQVRINFHLFAFRRTRLIAILHMYKPSVPLGKTSCSAERMPLTLLYRLIRPKP